MDLPDIDRLTRELAVRRGLQEALVLFSRANSAKLALPAALGALAADVASLLGTRRVAVWLFDRESELLTLAASSDRRDAQSAQTVRSDEDSPISAALRRDTPELTGSGATQSLAAPLRGWRRALGTLVIEGPAAALPQEAFVEAAGEFARQLAALVENRLVLDEAIARHHEYEQLRAQVRQSQKLASLGQLVASVAHEINNPLQGVLGHMELLIRSLPADAPNRPALERIYNDADRAARIADSLLVFAGSQRVPKERVRLHEVIEEAVAIHRSTRYRPDIELVERIATDLPPVMADRTLLQQAILNIVINAEQAIAGTAADGRIFLTAEREHRGVRIAIEDNGPGIAPALMEKIFDPFFTTKDMGKGTGLGLAITTGIIEEHGGTLTADTSPEGGARFTIRLPAAE
ncbi:MAG TPA: ATP-binding protein [Vicinamibacterales bacterium]|nr:ATP-binding protein [Vicinamibacterales bacterium]